MANLTEFPNLTFLALRARNLLNVHALAQLPNLQGLYMTADNAAINMTDLADCIHLDHLELTAAHLQNVNALAQLPNLTNLGLQAQNGDLDINDLAGYVHLTNLNVLAPNVQNEDAVAPLPNLLVLRVNGQIVRLNGMIVPVLEKFVVPAHAALPANAQDREILGRECGICLDPIENIVDCLVICSRTEVYHRNCLQNCRGRCPLCRTPLGPLP